MKTIEIVVARDGQTQVQTKGFAGPECRQASRLLEQALGIASQERCTEEFFQSVLSHSLRAPQGE